MKEIVELKVTRMNSRVPPSPVVVQMLRSRKHQKEEQEEEEIME